MKKHNVSMFSLKVFFSLLLTIFAIAANTLSQIPKPSPTTLPTASPTQTPAPKQTLADLQSKIAMRLMQTEVRRGRVGVKIISLNTGKVVFENDAAKYFMPASNMKNFTVATAMEKLTPDFKFVTSVYAPMAPDASGVIKGDLRIFGRGDISISNGFDPEFPKVVNPYWAIDRLADKIASAGVKRIEGNLVGDESYFTGDALPGTWEWDDLQTYYGTEVSALPLNDNAVDISVRSGASGASCSVAISPVNTIMRVVNKCTTTGSDIGSTLSVIKLLNQNIIEVTGTMPIGGEEYKNSIAFTHPAELFIELLRQRLLKKNIIVTGQNRVTNEKQQPQCASCPLISSIEIAKLESPPFAIIAQKTMKPSQNMYTETILRTLGEQVGRVTGTSSDSMSLGLGVVKSFLTSIGIPNDGIVQYDGSGLSRHDLITPEAVVTLYAYMAKQSKFAQAWRDSLTIGGVDGTLRNRFKGTAAAGNIRGKTGTIDQVSALSGYMTTTGGEPVILSIIVNDVPEPRQRTSLIDDIVINLANFDGKID